VYEPPQAAGVEIQQKAGRAAGNLQIGNDLRQVDGMQLFDGLDFDDDATFDQQIQSQVACDALTSILKSDPPLPFRLNPLNRSPGTPGR
jgi:hypothetical protein